MDKLECMEEIYFPPKTKEEYENTIDFLLITGRLTVAEGYRTAFYNKIINHED